jgi:MtrB/PioB family decaheme-associated outer membrane protein
MTTSVRIRLAAILASLLLAPTARAQEVEVGGFRASGEVEVGVRYFIDEPSPTRKGKLFEHRDITEGLFLPGLSLRLVRPDDSYGMEFSGSKWGQDDQEFAFTVGRLGRWTFGIEWNQTPHVYSTTGRTLAIESNRGVFLLPSPRPPLTAHNAGRELDEISMRTDTGRVFLLVTPVPDLELTAKYTAIRRDGDRPFGVPFGSPGNNFYEVLEPIDQLIHDFRLGAAIARENWQLQGGYALSIFVNDLERMRAANPCAPGAAIFGCSSGDLLAAGAPTRGQVSLAPDNMAHTLTIAGGVNLPMRTRLNAAASYALHLQDQQFLPHTINPLLVSPDLALPQDSLNGAEHHLVVNLTGVSRPWQPLTLTAKYRLHDLTDLSDELTFPGHVVNDRSLVIGERRAGRYEFTRQNFDLDGRYQVLAPLAVTLGAGWERWDRNKHREVGESDELIGKAAVDWSPLDWLLARLTYRPSFRRIHDYHTRAHLEHTVVEDPVAATQGQSLLLRKFDQADRDRHRFDALLQLSPVDTVSIAPTFGYRWDDYVDSPLGLQEEEAWIAGVDFSWNPIERLALSLSYSHEQIKQRMNSRSRPVIGGVGVDFPDFDWNSRIADKIDTITAGLRATLIPRRLDWIVNASYQYALGRVDTNNPVEPVSAPPNNVTATAKPWPAFEDELIHVDTALRYHINKSWTASLWYMFEAFQKNDWRTNQLNPFIGPNAVWLGNDYRNYDAHVAAVTLTYRFGQ